MRLTNLVVFFNDTATTEIYTVYESVSVPVPAEATNIVAGRVGGGSLATFGDDLASQMAPLFTLIAGEDCTVTRAMAAEEMQPCALAPVIV